MGVTKRALSVIYARVRDGISASGQEYDLKEVADRVKDEARRESLDEELLDQAIKNCARDYDRLAHDEAQGQLDFGPFGFGRELHIGATERILTEPAILVHVLADDELFDENFRAQQARKNYRDNRTRAILPYLVNGATVSMAIEAWRRDHPEQSVFPE